MREGCGWNHADGKGLKTPLSCLFSSDMPAPSDSAVLLPPQSVDQERAPPSLRAIQAPTYDCLADLAIAAPLLRYAAEWWVATSPSSAVSLLASRLCEAFAVATALCDSSSQWRQISHSPIALAIYPRGSSGGVLSVPLCCFCLSHTASSLSRAPRSGSSSGYTQGVYWRLCGLASFAL